MAFVKQHCDHEIAALKREHCSAIENMSKKYDSAIVMLTSTANQMLTGACYQIGGYLFTIVINFLLLSDRFLQLEARLSALPLLQPLPQPPSRIFNRHVSRTASRAQR